MIMCTVQLLRLKFTVTVSNSFEFFSPFFFLYALQGERIKDIKKKRCSLATLFTFEKKITIVIVDYYSRNFGKL